MKKFFARIANAFIESRQRQAARIIRDHSYLLAQYEVRIAVENTNMSEVAKTEPTPSMAPVEFKLAA